MRRIVILCCLLHINILTAKKDILSIRSSGDIIIGGLFPVHEKGNDGKSCGAINFERGIQRLEAMRYAVKTVNEDPNVLRGVKLGAKILDTCSDATYALDQSLDFVMSTLMMSEAGECTSGIKINSPDKDEIKSIMAVVGAAYSSVSIQVANLLRLFQIPQISYASTSAELSKKDRFGYFMRTVPPDTLQAKALVDIVQYFNWTYVSTVASEGEYGDSGITAFKNQYEQKRGQCIASSLRISRTADEKEYSDIVESLYKSRRAKVVILFVRLDDAAGILKAAKNLKLIDDFIWLASDGWGSATKVVNKNEDVAHGALTITLQSKYLATFDEYFKNLSPDNNKDNIWFDEFWQDQHRCILTNRSNMESEKVSETIQYDPSERFSSQNGTRILVNQYKYCDGNEKVDNFQQEAKIQFVYDAVYAVALALDRLYKERCGMNSSALCSNMSADSTTRSTLLRYIKENKTPGDYPNTMADPFGNAIRFDENGDSLGFYKIMNYRKDPITKKYKYEDIGSWEDNTLKLDVHKIVWPGPQVPNVPWSECSPECGIGYRKHMTDDNDCCWTCIKCEDNEYQPDEFSCAPCSIGRWPYLNRSACYDLQLKFVQWHTAFAFLPAILSSFGLAATVTTVMIFVKHIETPVVKAAGRELSFMLLIGCVVCYLGIFILLVKPSLVICTLQRFIIGAGFSIIYSALLVKTNRIYRIFASASKTTKRPACISPKSQIIIATLLASVQVVIFVIWLILEPPGVRQDIPDTNDKSVVVLKCKCRESSVLISLSYNMLLIFVCTIYAVLTRKIPSSFNESKFIGFTMYTTCIVWLSFVPIYFGLKGSYQIQVTTLCTAVFLCATVALLCLFGHKIHIILFQPNKNKRKTTSERQRFTTQFRIKTESDYVADSPIRSQCSSVTGSSPLHSGNTKKMNYELKDPTIPEELTSSLLVQKESSTDSILSSNDGNKATPTPNHQTQTQSSTDYKNEAESDLYNHRDSESDTEDNKGEGQENTVDEGVIDDPLAIDDLKNSSLANLNQSLLQSLDILTKSWRFVDNSSGDSSTPAITPSTCGHNDSGIVIMPSFIERSDGISDDDKPEEKALSEDADDNEPERLI